MSNKLGHKMSNIGCRDATRERFEWADEEIRRLTRTIRAQADKILILEEKIAVLRRLLKGKVQR